MAWTVTYDNVIQHPQTPAALQVTVRYHDESGKRPDFARVESVAALNEQFLRLCQGIKQSLEATDAVLATAPALGTPVDLSPLTPAPPDPPTQDELDRRQFQSDYNKMQGFKRAIDAGLKKATDADVTALITSLKAQLAAHPDYAQML